MDKGNVLVIGNSGVGKSTLINSVLGVEAAKTNWGKPGTTKLDIYENEDVPFRLIDTIGFEPSLIKELQAVWAVKKWSKESAVESDKGKQVNLIWFCVDGVAKRLFEETINDMLNAVSMWKSVPIIVVITKSFSEVDRPKNIQMVEEAFERKKGYKDRLRAVLPVVADAYPINENAIVPPYGISELIETTNALMPEGVRAAEKAVGEFVLKRKRALAQGVILPSIAAGAAVAALPIPMADAGVLGAVETAEVSAIARIYGIGDDVQEKELLQTIVSVGTVSVAAKAAISMLKAVPGVNIAAEVLNAVVAGGIIAALGEGCAFIFERIYLGEKDIADLAWVKKFLEQQLSGDFVDKMVAAIKSIGEKADAKSIAQLVAALFWRSEPKKS